MLTPGISFPGIRLPAFDASVVFASRSEAVCAILLEKYCEPWKTLNGTTFQVPVGSKRLDFVIGKTVIEFHPTVLSREFLNEQSWKTIVRQLKEVPGEVKNPLYDALKVEFRCQYFKHRRAVLDASERFKGHELLVADTDWVFCGIVKRFATSRCSQERLFAEFQELHRTL